MSSDQRVLDPGVAEILAKVRDAGLPPWHTLDVDVARERYRQRAALLATEPTQVDHVDDVMIDGPAGPLRVRVVDPGVSRPAGVLVYLHGGGWTLGDLDTFEEVCRRLAVAAGCLVVAPDYRLAPEHPYPAALDDALATLRWVTTAPAALAAVPGLGGDLAASLARIAVGGDSAGGNLAAAACLRLRDQGAPLPAMQLLIYPALRARFDTSSYARNASGYLLTREDCQWFWSNFLGDTPADDPYACPGEADDLAGLPPAVVVTAGLDPLCDEGRAYARRLEAAGVAVTPLHYEQMVHGFVGLPTPLPAGRDAAERAGLALRAVWSGTRMPTAGAPTAGSATTRTPTSGKG